MDSQPSTPTADRTRLEKKYLLPARLVWLVGCALFLGTFVINLPSVYTKLHTILQQPDWAAATQGLGLSLQPVALYLIGMCILSAAAFIIVALIMVWRRSDDWLILFFSFTIIAIGIGINVILPHPWPLLLLEEPWLQTIALAALVPALQLVPDGRFVPRWSILLAILWPIIVIWFYLGYSEHIWFSLVFIPLHVIFLCAVIGMQVYRYRNSYTPTQQQQIKWLLFGITLMILGLAVGVITRMLFFPPSDTIKSSYMPYLLFIWTPFYQIPRILFPFFAGTAFLRYRLWDVDFIINRSLVYGALTALLAAVFAISLLIISSLFKGFAGGPLVAVAISAAIFGAIFQPARRRLRRFVDRRFYQIEIDYRKTPPPGLAARPSQPLSLPHTFFDNYQDLTLIGRGGMAEVYKATHPTQNRVVAIKLLPAALAEETGFYQRFQRETRIMAQLQHPNIVRVLDSGDEDGVSYIVMEYLNGEDLRALLGRQGSLPLEQALPILGDVAAALDYAHAQGLVHRDIKPSNVMLDRGTSSTRAVLMDFGIAKILGGETALTRTGMMGTLDYVAPEQIRDSSQVDGRVDIYSLGVMTYQMLTGQLPFKSQHPGALLIAHLQQPAPDPRLIIADLPKEAARAIQQAMAKKPEERYATAGEFVDGLTSERTQPAMKIEVQ